MNDERENYPDQEKKPSQQLQTDNVFTSDEEKMTDKD